MKAANIKKLDREIVSNYVSQIVSKQYDSKIVEVTYMGGGSYGMAYKVVQDKPPAVLVAKVYKVKDLHKIEAFDLKTLAEHTSMHIPKVYFTFDKSKEIPVDCLCMEFVEGKDCLTHLGFLVKSRKKKKAFAQKIIQSVLEIHSFKNPKFGTIENPVYDSWLDYYRPFAEDVLDAAQQLCRDGKLEHYIVEAMEKAFERFDDIFSEKVLEACLIHGDLNVMNIMADPKTFTPLAIIDPLESKFADREYDLFQLNNLTGKIYGLYKLYKEKYPVSRNCDIKCAFYGLYNEVYVFIKAGTLVKMIMNPLVKNMKKQLKNFK